MCFQNPPRPDPRVWGYQQQRFLPRHGSDLLSAVTTTRSPTEEITESLPPAEGVLKLSLDLLCKVVRINLTLIS